MRKKAFYNEIIVGFIVIIGLGLFQTFEFQQNSVQPLELAASHLDRIMVSSDSSTILSDIFFVKENIPNSGNPVFIYPTYSTDFGRMQEELDSMVTIVEKTQTFQQDSSGFHTGIIAVGDRALVLQENLEDVKPYLYASLPNVFFNAIWLIGTMGLVETLIRKSESIF